MHTPKHFYLLWINYLIYGTRTHYATKHSIQYVHSLWLFTNDAKDYRAIIFIIMVIIIIVIRLDPMLNNNNRNMMIIDDSMEKMGKWEKNYQNFMQTHKQP